MGSPPSSMDKKRPQLEAEDLGRLRWLLGSGLALLSVVTVFFMDIAAGPLMPLVAVAAIAGLLWPTWPARLPRFVHRLAFPVIVLAFVYDLTSSSEPLPALIRLDLMLILYRVSTYRQRRDDLQLVVLGLFLVIVAGVITVSLSFAVQIVAFTGCALVMLLAVTLEYADGDAAKAPDPTVVPAWARGSWGGHFRRLRAATDWRLAALGVAGFAAVVVLSGLLFLAIPRFDLQSGLFLDRLISRTTRTGFSDSIKFGEVTSIIADDSLALLVDVTDPAVMPTVPYFRMVVLDEYNGEGFEMSDQFRLALSGNHRVPRGRINGTPGFERDAPTWTFYLEPGISRFLPLLGNFYTLSFTEPQTFSFNTDMLAVALERDPPKMLAYRTWSMSTGGRVRDASFALARRNGQPRGQQFMDLSALEALDRTRLDRLVRDATPGAIVGDVTGFVQAAVVWLGEQHPYALDSALPEGRGDPLLRWLDSETPGHCEFFAGSLVLMARAAGYPARLVTGFAGGTWNSYSGSFTVRNSNAHAWCEVFDDASGAWLRVDPTPGNAGLAALGDEAALAAGLAARTDTGWQARIESLRVFWYRRIVNFDQDTQAEITSAVTTWFKSRSRQLSEFLENSGDAVKRWARRPWGIQRFVPVAGGIAGLVCFVWLWRRHGSGWWLRLRSRHSRPDQDPVRRAASKWLRRGAKRKDFDWPAEVREALLRLRFGAADSWPGNPMDVFRAAKLALRRR